jgi:hypothetical protein
LRSVRVTQSELFTVARVAAAIGRAASVTGTASRSGQVTHLQAAGTGQPIPKVHPAHQTIGAGTQLARRGYFARRVAYSRAFKSWLATPEQAVDPVGNTGVITALILSHGTNAPGHTNPDVICTAVLIIGAMIRCSAGRTSGNAAHRTQAAANTAMTPQASATPPGRLATGRPRVRTARATLAKVSVAPLVTDAKELPGPGRHRIARPRIRTRTRTGIETLPTKSAATQVVIAMVEGLPIDGVGQALIDSSTAILGPSARLHAALLLVIKEFVTDAREALAALKGRRADLHLRQVAGKARLRVVLAAPAIITAGNPAEDRIAEVILRPDLGQAAVVDFIAGRQAARVFTRRVGSHAGALDAALWAVAIQRVIALRVVKTLRVVIKTSIDTYPAVGCAPVDRTGIGMSPSVERRQSRQRPRIKGFFSLRAARQQTSYAQHNWRDPRHARTPKPSYPGSIWVAEAKGRVKGQ